MRYRPLGGSGILISEIGFGTWGLGGTRGGSIAYGPTDDRQSLAALRRAYEHGVTFFDTADLYGCGHSERLLGEAFHQVRSDVFLTTKAGFRDAAGNQDFSAAYLEQSLEASVRRLRTDYVDLFLVHSPPRALLEDSAEIAEALERLKRRGLARAVGVSVRAPDDGLVVAATLAPDAIEVNYNLADQRAAANGLFDLCRETKVGVIVRTPLCFGFLTGAYSEQDRFDEGDHRGRWSAEQRARWTGAQQSFWSSASAAVGQTPAQYALRFCLTHPGVSTVIPGMLSPAHVDENTRASDLGPLPVREQERIRALYEGQEFFLGRRAS